MAIRTEVIADGVHRLALFGVNAYLVHDGAAWVLIDAAYPGVEEELAQAIDALSGGARPVGVLLTHGHPDHAGAAVALARRWDVPVQISRADLPYVDGTALYPEPFVALLRRVLPARAMESLRRCPRTAGVGGGPHPRPHSGSPGVLPAL